VRDFKRIADDLRSMPNTDGPPGDRLIRLAAAPPDVPQGTARRLRILVVDDVELNRKLLRTILADFGHTIIEAGDGPTAIEMAFSERFDLILMDVHMPQLDGPSAARAIRGGAGPNVATPILALTADTRSAKIAECTAAGMDGYLTKPISLADLLAAVASLDGPQD
jgi:CheY-like chemotaxis protein